MWKNYKYTHNSTRLFYNFLTFFLQMFIVFIVLFIINFTFYNTIFTYNFNYYNFGNYLSICEFSINLLTLIYSYLVFIIMFLLIFVILLTPIHLKKEYINSLLLIFFLTIITFFVKNILLFLITFESTLLPLLVLISFYGSTSRKFKAAYFLLFYTLIGSVFLVIGLFEIYLTIGSFDLITIKYYINYIVYNGRYYIFLLLPFLIKIPCFGFHSWLVEAHVESSTPGSILLAGVILKLGSFGLLTYIILIFTYSINNYFNFLFNIFNFGVITTSIVGLFMLDIKKIIAYSSIVHLNFSTNGVLTNKVVGFLGYGHDSIHHSLSSSALFLLAGKLYLSLKERTISYISGGFKSNSFNSVSWSYNLLANMGIPLTSGFVSEFLLSISFIEKHIIIFFLSIFSLFIMIFYSLQLFKLLQNTPKNYFYFDDNKLNYYILLFINFLIFLLGINPNITLSLLNNIKLFNTVIL